MKYAYRYRPYYTHIVRAYNAYYLWFVGVFSPQTFDLADIEAKRVTYTATQREIGADTVYDSLNLTITNGQLIINNKKTPDINIQVKIVHFMSLVTRPCTRNDECKR